MRPSLWICQCMKVVRRSTFCIRYMPTLRVPVCGSCVITAGSVMNGAGSPGQQRWIGSRSRSTSSPVSTTSWAGPLRTVFGPRVGDRLQLLEPPDLLREPLRRLHLEHVARAWRRPRRALGASKARHMRRSVPNWLISSGWSDALRLGEQQRRPAGLDGAVDDLGDLEVGIDLGVDADELALALEQRDPVAKTRRAEAIRWSVYGGSLVAKRCRVPRRPRTLTKGS